MVQTEKSRPSAQIAIVFAIIPSLVRFVVLATILLAMYGCISNFHRPKPASVQVTSLEGEQDESTLVPARMSRAQLLEELERFAFRYAGRINQLLRTIELKANTPEQRLRIHKWKSHFIYSLVEIVIGKDSETNLLDMVVLTSLVRIESEEYLVPNIFSGEEGQAWLAAIRQGEKEIWTLAEKGLDEQQQIALQKLISDWRAHHPERTNLAGIRFSDFAAEVAESEFELLSQPGGILPEVSEATRAVDEVRHTAERAMFLLFVSPHLARLEAENLVYDLATQSEFKELQTTINRFSAASSKLIEVSGQLPSWLAAERQAAINQAMDRLFAEREQFYTEIDERALHLKELLSQMQETLTVGDHLAGQVTETMTTVDSLVTRLKLDKPSSGEKGFRIEDYRDTLVEAAVAAREIDQVLQSLARPLAPGLDDQTRPAWATALQELDQHIERWILLESIAIAGLAVFIAVVVVCALLVYRRTLARLQGTR